MRKALLVVLSVIGAGMVNAQSSMVVPVTVRNGNIVQFVEIGYSPYNTFTIDGDTLLGPFLEAPAPPQAPAYALEVRLQTIPSRTEGLGLTGTYKDFRDYRGASQVDSFLVEIAGSGPSNGLRINPTVITWPKTLDRYGSAWAISTPFDATIPVTDMLAVDSVVIPVKQFAQSHYLLIVKTGAVKTSHPAAFRTLTVGDPGFYVFEFPKFPPAAVMQFANAPGLGSIHVARFADAAANVSFSGTAPAYVAAYRWVIAQAGLKTYSATLRLQYGQFASGISSGAGVTIYRRPKEGTGAFQSLSTGYTPGISEVTTTVSEFGEFILTSNSPFTGVQVSGDQPLVFGLEQNYPNPFNPQTEIVFSIAARSAVDLAVYSLLGQRVRTLVSQEREAGTYRETFDARGLSSGMYFYVLRAAGHTFTRRMLLVR